MGRVLDKGIAVSMGLMIALLISNTWLDYRNTRKLSEAAAQGGPTPKR